MRLSIAERPWLLVSAAWVAPALLGAVNQVVQQKLWGGPPVTVGALLYAISDWLVYAALTPAVFALSHRWPIERAHLTRRVFIHLGFAILFCGIWVGAGRVLKAVLQPEPTEHSLTLEFVAGLFFTLPFGVAVYLAVVGAEHATRYFLETTERELQIARLSQQLSSAQLRALQGQLNPHFLFNTLNTLAVLVRDGERVSSGRLIEQLSDVLRRTLTRHQTHEVPLREELQLVRQYLAIEQARFSDRLKTHFHVDASAHTAAVPSFSVQQLVENAIKHGIAPRLEAGVVTIEVQRAGDMLEIAVSDDGPGIDETAGPLQGHGLENTRDRLRALYGERASLVLTRRTPGGTLARLLIPYRQITDHEHDAG